jgi:AcrR family transcriptional regulator
MDRTRKTPAQNRSQELFNSIIESAARILPALGYARTTTNRIAVKAGISIGSLYQYFPHKDAIFAKLLKRELNKHFEETTRIVKAEAERPLEEIIDLLVERFYGLYLGQKNLSRELFTHASRLEQVSQILYVRNEVVETLSQLLVEKKDLEPAVAKAKVFIGLNAFMGVIQTCSLLETPPIPDGEAKRQIAKLLKGYLC